MSRKCTISKKGNQLNHTVSHANNKRRKISRANLQWKRLFDSETGRWVRVKISMRTLRTVSKKGLATTLRDSGLKLDDMRRG